MIPQLAVLGAAAFASRRYYRNWGATHQECETTYPGDELAPDPAITTTQAVSIDAPAEVIWQWLVQIGQGRGGMYSYEKLENAIGLDIHNADEIRPEWQDLKVGDEIRLVPKGWMGIKEGLALPVAQLNTDEYIVLREDPEQTPWNAVWSFHIVPRWTGNCRLISHSRQHRSNWGDVIGAEVTGPVTLFMTRKMLLGIKERAERTASLR